MLYRFFTTILIESKQRLEHRSGSDDELASLPFYGGARGQVLQIKRNPDGSVISEIVPNTKEVPMNEVRREMSSFQQNLIDIQQAASQLVTLQQNIKLSGKLTETDHRLYAENLQKLGISAQNLAHIQLAGGQDDFRLLFEGPLFGSTDDKEQEFPAEAVRSEQDPDEESVGEETGTTTTAKPTTDDSVQVSVPEKEASVAEAKPVGLAIAGEGGVASSKPVATAVVGAGGLAVARPIATAIAGVSPSEVASLGIPLSNRFKSPNFRDVPEIAHVSINVPTVRKYGLAQGTGRDRIGLLVGPDYQRDPNTEEPISAEDPIQPNGIKIEEVSELPEVTLNSRLPSPQDNELLLPPITHQNRPHLAAEHISHHSPAQYPFIPPVSPYRFNWDSEPVDQAPHYEPLPFFDKRAYSYPHFYPFQQNVLPIHPYHFQNQFH